MTTVSFLLRRSTTSFPASTSDGTGVTSTIATSFIDTGLSDNVYYYSLFARDSYGNDSSAGTASIPIDTTAPNVPSGFSASVSASNVSLTWSNPIDLDFSSSTIRRSTTSYPVSTTDEIAVTSTIATSYSDLSLADGTYYYSIFAIDTTGNISARATALATVDTSARIAPASGGGASVVPSFVAPAAINAAMLGFSVSNGFGAASMGTTISSPTAKLRLNADPATVRGYAASLDPLFQNVSMFPLSPSGEVTLALPNTPGTYTVYLKYYSLSGESSPVIAQTLTYAPTVQPLPTTNPVSTKTTPIFTRILHQGNSGADVKALQTFLNARGFTVAKTGQGSPGQETTFFGPATAKALKKFQEAYKDTILKPYNLEKGTGILGAGTIAAMKGMK